MSRNAITQSPEVISDITDPVYLFSMFSELEEGDKVDLKIPPVLVSPAPFSWKLIGSHPDSGCIMTISSDEESHDGNNSSSLSAEDLITIFCADAVLYTPSNGFLSHVSPYDIANFITNTTTGSDTLQSSIAPDFTPEAANRLLVEYPFVIVGSLKAANSGNRSGDGTEATSSSQPQTTTSAALQRNEPAKIIKTGSSSILIVESDAHGVPVRSSLALAEKLPPFRVIMEYTGNERAQAQLQSSLADGINLSIELLNDCGKPETRRKPTEDYVASINAIDEHVRRFGLRLKNVVKSKFSSDLIYFKAVMFVRDATLIMLKPERTITKVRIQGSDIAFPLSDVYSYSGSSALRASRNIMDHLAQTALTESPRRLYEDSETKLNAIWQRKKHE